MEIWFEDGKWWRVCNFCGKPSSGTNKYNQLNAYKKARKCASCARKPEHNPNYGNTGELNPFYGKRHSEETKRKIANADKSSHKTEEFREKMKTVWKDIHATREHLSVYEYKLKNEGLASAQLWLEKDRQKKSARAKGSNNPMFGKPSPQGSGYGWKGYYKGKFFRSLRELKFMLDNPEAVCGESKFWTACYEFNGRERTTRPDFILEKDKIVVECKPERLHISPNVLAKKKAMDDLCVSRGYRYLLVDPGIVAKEDLISLIEQDEVQLLASSRERFEKWAS